MEDVLAGTSYRAIRVLGAGGFATVYEAVHQYLDGPSVAVKLLNREHASDSSTCSRLREEARTLGRLSHPNLVSVKDSGDTLQGLPFFVMELLRGESLKTRLQRGRLPLQQALQIIQGVCNGVACLHANGVLHRDLKPSNIFLTRTPEGREVVKIIDLGIAKVANARWEVQTQEGKYLGTLAYMPPEQLLGKTQDARVDVYAVGAVLYRMLTGQLPICRDTHGSMLLAVLEEVPLPLSELVPEIPEYVVQVVARALAKAPDERFPSIEQMMRALSIEEEDEDTPTKICPVPKARPSAGSRRAETGTEELSIGQLALTRAVPFVRPPRSSPADTTAPLEASVEKTPLSASYAQRFPPPAPSSRQSIPGVPIPPSVKIPPSFGSPPLVPSFLATPQPPGSSSISCKAPPSSSPCVASVRSLPVMREPLVPVESEYERAAPWYVRLGDRVWQWVHEWPLWATTTTFLTLTGAVVTCSVVVLSRTWAVLFVAVFLLCCILATALLSRMRRQ